MSLALYVHIPFCAARCPYCDFNTYAGLDALYRPYIAALAEEIRRAGAQRSRPAAHTVFIGGGTPTVLPNELFEKVLRACQAAFDIAPDAELTSEANPGTVDQAHFAALRAMGVNRLSMGVQSFDDAELRFLGRIHDAGEAEAAIEAARSAGFDNINLDFIFGLPGQDPATWRRTLLTAAEFQPEHLSLYSLTVESGTPLAEWVQSGQVAEPDDDLAADLYLGAAETLAGLGLFQYEISNWAREGRQCRHNLVYWRNEPYLGFGAGAHSFDGERRWWNHRGVADYIARVRAGQEPEADSENIDRRLAMGETLMLGLRLVDEGVTDARFRSRFGVGLFETFGAEIEKLLARGLLEQFDRAPAPASPQDRGGAGVRLAARGRLLGNQVFAEFLP